MPLGRSRVGENFQGHKLVTFLFLVTICFPSPECTDPQVADFAEATPPPKGSFTVFSPFPAVFPYLQCYLSSMRRLGVDLSPPANFPSPRAENSTISSLPSPDGSCFARATRVPHMLRRHAPRQLEQVSFFFCTFESLFVVLDSRLLAWSQARAGERTPASLDDMAVPCGYPQLYRS